MHPRIALPAIAALALLPAAPTMAGQHEAGSSEKSIVEIASSDEQLSTLVSALKAGDLVETLRGDGPFTVFAPTNAAFENLPEGAVKDLLQPKNRSRLKRVLTYHVVPRKVTAGDVLNLEDVGAEQGAAVGTVQGQKLTVRIGKGAVQVNDGRVVQADIEARNGVIHKIDSLLQPQQISAQRALEMIDEAVDEGVALFNDGHQAECAALYRKTCTAIPDAAGESVPAKARDALRHAVGLAEHVEDVSDRAWSLRYGMNAARRIIKADGE